MDQHIPGVGILHAQAAYDPTLPCRHGLVPVGAWCPQCGEEAKAFLAALDPTADERSETERLLQASREWCDDQAKREQQAARFDSDPGDCADGLTIEKLGSIPVITPEWIESVVLGEPGDFDIARGSEAFAAGERRFLAAVDAGSIGDTRTDRRRAWDVLDQRRQEDVQQAVAETLVGMRHEPLEQRIAAVINAVLDA